MTNEFALLVDAARPALEIAHPNVVDVLVRVQAPDKPATGLPERPRLNLAIVLDRSGSMSGRPLHEAKRCARFMIDNLKQTDRAAVIAYDDSIQILMPSQPVTDKQQFLTAIAHLRDGGSTNLHGGWLAGAEQAAANLGVGVISRVLLLSDGNANHGVTEVDEIASQCAQLAETGVTTSTYGLGPHFNEQLMVEMARSGRGNPYYSEAAEALLDNFLEESSLLSALCARDVRLEVRALPGVRVELLNPYSRNAQGQWCLPDVAYEAQVWAGLRLHLDQSIVSAVQDKVAVLQVKVVYRDLNGAEHGLPEIWLSLPVVSPEDFNNVVEDAAIKRWIWEAEAARLQDEASQAAARGDWNAVDGALVQVRGMAADNPLLGDIASNLERLAAQRDGMRFGKEALYTAASLSSRQRSKHDASDPSDLPTYLQRKVRQGGSRRHKGGSTGAKLPEKK
jgi:Ca-activated chloride channel family protein